MNKTIEEIFYSEYIDFISLKNKITTNKNIKYKFKNYIIPFFKDIPISNIDTKKYIDFQLYLKNFKYSKSFYEQIHFICKNFYDYLKIYYNIENIPQIVGNFNIDNYYRSYQKKGIFTKQEYKKFIKVVDNIIYKTLFDVLFYCGLRKGEALALKVNDFKDNSLIINKTITKELFNGKRVILTPKSEKSNRIIKLDLITSHKIKKLIKYYTIKYDNFNNNFFLFGGEKPISCTTLERKKNEFCKKTGVKQIRIHDFRHSHATFLYKNNVKIKSIQERLGHSSPDITLRTYIHSDKKDEKRLIKIINLLHL